MRVSSKLLVRLTLSLSTILTLRYAARADATGADAGLSGAPGDGTCISCHRSTLNAGTGSLKISFANGNTYVPGQTQSVTVTLTDPTAKRWGFEASPRVASAASSMGAGKVATSDSFTRIAGTSGTLQWITHTQAGTRNGTTGGVSFQFNWTPPSTDVGAVDFYVTGNAANGNNQDDSGDKIYSTKATLTAQVSNPNTPTIAAGGVVNAASGVATIESGSWVTVYGTNLAPSTVATGRSWNSADIVNGVLPTTLDGTSVTINGKAAAISWISNNQLNVQAPDDASTGPVDVVVKTANGTSAAGSVNLQQISPGVFTLATKYAAAVLPDGSYAVAQGVLGSSVATRGATAGDVVQVFGTGFGPTSPAVTSGVVYSGAAATANAVAASIGGVPAAVQFAGITGAGLYQINVTVPAGVPGGDQPLVLSVGGIPTQDNLYLTIR
jgi:uncharacterized protein (TIGR03437 family)